MHIPAKQLVSGFRLPVYGLGMGGKREVTPANDAQEVATILKLIEQGITHIDTAEKYAFGHSEELLGQVLRHCDRSKLVIATKVASDHQSREGIFRACEGSLDRMGTDYIDLYLLHRHPDQGFTVREAIQALNDLVDQGVVKHIGVSNFSPERFQEAQSYSAHKLVCNQVHYNVEQREAQQRGVVDYCQKNDVMLVAWRPLERGNFLQVPILAELAEKYQKTPAQIAINWLVSQPNVVVISRTSTLQHFDENIGALDFTMSQKDIDRLRRDYPNQKIVSEAEALDNGVERTEKLSGSNQ